MKPRSGGVPACVGTDVLHDVRLGVCVCVLADDCGGDHRERQGGCEEV